MNAAELKAPLSPPSPLRPRCPLKPPQALRLLREALWSEGRKQLERSAEESRLWEGKRIRVGKTRGFPQRGRADFDRTSATCALRPIRVIKEAMTSPG